jgi:hypothetical protein
MQGRRFVLKAVLGLWLLPLLPPPVARPGPGAAARPPAPGFRLVNGWILTDRDVAALDAGTGRAAGR